MQSVPETTIDEVVNRYPVLLLDAFGVLVDGSGALPGAVELIDRLNAGGKPYYVLTNDASRLPAARAARLQSQGLAVGPEAIITSGSLLREHFAAHGLVGARCLMLGTEDSARYVADAGGRVVSATDPFEVLVIGNQPDEPSLTAMNAVLSALFRRLDRDERVHLIVPNPDAFYPEAGGDVGFASGGVAAMFEAALQVRYPHRPGLRFVRLGKPHAAIFAEALRRSGTRAMVMVGDQLETDIRGARAFGLDAVWVTPAPTEALATLPHELWPTYHLRSLAGPSR